MSNATAKPTGQQPGKPTIIRVADLDDMPTILDSYAHAAAFQKTVSSMWWKGFDEPLIQTEIREGRLFKVLDGRDIACVFSVTYADPEIWGEREAGDAIYIHRISTREGFHGRGYARPILLWCEWLAAVKSRMKLRIDTWAENERLCAYYQSCGFQTVGFSTPEEGCGLPRHYWGTRLCLLEKAVIAVEDASSKIDAAFFVNSK